MISEKAALPKVLVTESRGYGSGLDDASQIVEREWLGEAPHGRRLQKLVRFRAHDVARHEDESTTQPWVTRLNLPVEADTIEHRHLDVAEDHIERLVAELGECNLPVLRGLDRVTIGTKCVA